MRFSDAVLESWSNDEYLSIFVDEEPAIEWWRAFPDRRYNYTCDKNLDPLKMRSCLTMNFGSEMIGFVTSVKKILTSDAWGFSAYDTYIDTLEFGCDYDELDYFFRLIEYYTEYARYMGAKFIRVARKEEEFLEFYSRLGWYADDMLDDCFIIEVEDPIEYDEFVHLRHYDTDLLTFRDVAFLGSLGFSLKEDVCTFGEGDSQIVVSRTDGSITFPDFVFGESGVLFDEKSYSLMFFITRNLKKIKKQTLTVGLKISDLPYELAALGDERIVVFKDISRDEGYFDFLYKINKETDFPEYSCYVAEMDDGELYNRCYYQDRKISVELANVRLCLDIEGCTNVAPYKSVNEDRAFNSLLSEASAFAVGFKEADGPRYAILIYLSEGKLRLIIDSNERELDIDTEECLCVLRNAHFSNWRGEYIKESDEDLLSWGVVIDLPTRRIAYRGTNDAPRIWKYFILELLDFINKSLK